MYLYLYLYLYLVGLVGSMDIYVAILAQACNCLSFPSISFVPPYILSFRYGLYT